MTNSLFKDTAVAYNLFPGRPSPVTALALIAIGMSLTAVTRKGLQGAARLGACGAIVAGLVSLVGYLWDAGELVTDRWLPPIAVNTAICCVLLGVGVLLVSTPSKRRSDISLQSLVSVEIKVLGGFVIALSLMLIGGSFTYRTNVRFADSVEWIAHTEEVRASVASLYGSLAGAEVALRDYLLLPDPEHRHDYQLLADSVRHHLSTLEILTADNPDQQRNLAALKPIVAARLESMSSAHASLFELWPAGRASRHRPSTAGRIRRRWRA